MKCKTVTCGDRMMSAKVNFKGRRKKISHDVGKRSQALQE